MTESAQPAEWMRKAGEEIVRRMETEVYMLAERPTWQNQVIMCARIMARHAPAPEERPTSDWHFEAAKELGRQRRHITGYQPVEEVARVIARFAPAPEERETRKRLKHCHELLQHVHAILDPDVDAELDKAIQAELEPCDIANECPAPAPASPTVADHEFYPSQNPLWCELPDKCLAAGGPTSCHYQRTVREGFCGMPRSVHPAAAPEPEKCQEPACTMDAAQQAASTIVCGLDIRYEPGYATRADVIAAVTKLIEGRCFDQAHDEMRLLRVKLVTAETQRDSAKTDAYAALERAKAAEQQFTACGSFIKDVDGNRWYHETLLQRAGDGQLAAEQRAEEAERDAQHMAERYQDLGRESHEEHERIDVALGIPEDANRPRTVEVTLKAIAELRRERDEATAKLKEARVMLRRMTQIVVNEFSVDPGHVESYRNVKAYQYDVDAALAALDAPAKPE